MELKWFLGVVALAFYGLVMAAIVSKYREVRRASLWVPAAGKIVSSRSEARKVKRASGSGRPAIEDTEIRNFAAIRYEFAANGRVMRGDRISIADDLGNFEVAEKLQRYPVGTAVTVFHDRNRPQDCVLERNLATRPFAIAVAVGTLFGACLLLLIGIGSGAMDALGELGADAGRSSAAIFAAVLGLLLVAFALGLHRRGATTFAWPKTAGTIVSSNAEAVRVRFRGGGSPWASVGTMFRSRTTYAYRVAGVAYQSDRTSFGAQSYASFRLLARLGAARFVVGAPVDVFYDPLAPAQSVLTRGAPGQFAVWLAALAMLGTTVLLLELF